MFFLSAPLIAFLLVLPFIVAGNFVYYLRHQRFFTRPRWMRFVVLWTVGFVPIFFLSVFDLGSAWLRFPLLALLALPLLVLVSVVLYLFGQQPDTLVRAFTDSYKHGFSQQYYLWDIVQCGGLFL